ncbi:uncharacterized membrane protein At1g16860-like [Lycium ferocissimum]|uniref:uncharacterized membrane protein At1g16860-like n=1 Tax=Lycium ferocissimum TaxID=112874 RepID=UPI0028151F48|nr:uncharacterized membrane protein At1g16860-like [Lycium ferocissimum]
MGSRFPSHQLSNGLYVSGRPEQPKERTPTMTSAPMPYTGGDIKKSGELGKMFDIPVDGSKSRKSGPITSGPARTGLYTAASSHSGPINSARTSYSTSGPISSSGVPGAVSTKKSNSGPLSKHGEPIKKSSGPQSGGVTPTGRQHSGPQSCVIRTLSIHNSTHLQLPLFFTCCPLPTSTKNSLVSVCFNPDASATAREIKFIGIFQRC